MFKEPAIKRGRARAMFTFDTIEDLVIAVSFAVSTDGAVELVMWAWALI